MILSRIGGDGLADDGEIRFTADVDDLEAVTLAHDIVKRIEKDLEYPGQIKATIIRETRVVDYAK